MKNIEGHSFEELRRILIESGKEEKLSIFGKIKRTFINFMFGTEDNGFDFKTFKDGILHKRT